MERRIEAQVGAARAFYRSRACSVKPKTGSGVDKTAAATAELGYSSPSAGQHDHAESPENRKAEVRPSS